MLPRQGLVDMDSAEVASSWLELIVRFESWDESAALIDGPFDCGISRAARASLMAELCGVAAGPALLSPAPSPWERLVARLPSWPSSPADECSRRRRALLGSYERLCELDLPLHVSNLLIRQYGAIRCAAIEVEFRARAPAWPGGLVPARPPGHDVPAAFARDEMHNLHIGNIGSRHRSC